MGLLTYREFGNELAIVDVLVGTANTTDVDYSTVRHVVLLRVDKESTRPSRGSPQDRSRAQGPS